MKKKTARDFTEVSITLQEPNDGSLLSKLLHTLARIESHIPCFFFSVVEAKEAKQFSLPVFSS